DAAACWLNALWEQEVPTVQFATGWRLAEAKGQRWHASGHDLGRWLSAATAPGGARGVAAFVVWAALQEPPPPVVAAPLPDLQRELDGQEAGLPVRAAWLARLALARLAGGDVLGLARARDRLLERLFQKGLSLELDLPRFLRFAGSNAGEHGREIADWLLRLKPQIHRWVKGLGDERGGAGQMHGLGVGRGARLHRPPA